jgi:hypothetical protein
MVSQNKKNDRRETFNRIHELTFKNGFCNFDLNKWKLYACTVCSTLHINHVDVMRLRIPLCQICFFPLVNKVNYVVGTVYFNIPLLELIDIWNIGLKSQLQELMAMHYTDFYDNLNTSDRLMVEDHDLRIIKRFVNAHLTATVDIPFNTSNMHKDYLRYYYPDVIKVRNVNIACNYPLLLGEIQSAIGFVDNLITSSCDTIYESSFCTTRKVKSHYLGAPAIWNSPKDLCVGQNYCKCPLINPNIIVNSKTCFKFNVVLKQLTMMLGLIKGHLQ